MCGLPDVSACHFTSTHSTWLATDGGVRKRGAARGGPSRLPIISQSLARATHHSYELERQQRVSRRAGGEHLPVGRDGKWRPEAHEPREPERAEPAAAGEAARAFGIDAEGKQVHQQAFSVDVVDVTGAGDVFHGAYLFGIHKGWDMARTLRFASAAAALKCRRRGARDGIPTYRQTINFLAGREEYHA